MSSVLVNLFSFQGRMRRLDFWLYSAGVFAMILVTASAIAAMASVDLASKADMRAPLIEALSVLLFMWPNLAVCAKRLHDRGQSGWWVLLTFLPVIGNVWMLINMGILRGDEGPNRYGPAPARPQLSLIARPA